MFEAAGQGSVIYVNKDIAAEQDEEQEVYRALRVLFVEKLFSPPYFFIFINGSLVVMAFRARAAAAR